MSALVGPATRSGSPESLAFSVGAPDASKHHSGSSPSSDSGAVWAAYRGLSCPLRRSSSLGGPGEATNALYSTCNGSRSASLLGRPRSASPRDITTVRRRIFSPTSEIDDGTVVAEGTGSCSSVHTEAGRSGNESITLDILPLPVTLPRLVLPAHSGDRSSLMQSRGLPVGRPCVNSPRDAQQPVTDPATDFHDVYHATRYAADRSLLEYRRTSPLAPRRDSAWDVLNTADAYCSPTLAFGDVGKTGSRTPWQHYDACAGTEALITSEFAAVADDPLCGFPTKDARIPGYLLGHVVGRGGFSSVHKALHVATGVPVAIKVIDKQRLRDHKERDRVDREVRVLRQLGTHVGIVALLESVETSRYLYLIQEYCAGGSLLDLVRLERSLPEWQAAMVFQQLLAVLHHCHRKGVVHRDVKLENVLLDDRGNLRLIDFGLCGYFLPDKMLRCHCGSPSYAAPEIVARREYLAPPVDVWSAGVVLYAMLAGYLPFHAQDKRALGQKILQGDWRAPDWISDDAADLLKRMMEVDPAARIALDDIWAHPWVAGASQRWRGLGEGPGGLIRGRVDAATGVPIPDPVVVAAWKKKMTTNGSQDTDDRLAALIRALRHRECNADTAMYHLLSFAARQEVI